MNNIYEEICTVVLVEFPVISKYAQGTPSQKLTNSALGEWRVRSGKTTIVGRSGVGTVGPTDLFDELESTVLVLLSGTTIRSIHSTTGYLEYGTLARSTVLAGTVLVQL